MEIKTLPCNRKLQNVYTHDSIIEMVKRDNYLAELVSLQGNGMIKITMGMRRCGEPYLPFKIFVSYLKQHGITSGHITKVDLEDFNNNDLRSPDICIFTLKIISNIKRSIVCYWMEFRCLIVSRRFSMVFSECRMLMCTLQVAMQNFLLKSQLDTI